MQPTIIADRIRVPESYGMVSALAEQSSVPLWDYTVGKNGIHWFWPTDHDEAGAMVHCGSPVMAGKRSGGYGGRTITFMTKDGGIDIQGPWHSNSDALFEETGVDIRDRHRTYGIVSMNRDYDGTTTIMVGVVHADPEDGAIGTFGRIEEMAKKFADRHERPFYYYRKSRGGSSCGSVYPTGWTDKQIREYWESKSHVDSE